MPDIYEGLNSEQVLCVKALDGPVLVLAGAGSGKTRVLTHRIACLINEKGVSPYNILAITFTNKAANEMKERLESMLGATDGMWICTIHSMCNRILRQFIDRIGYTKNFSIYSEDDKERVLKRLISEKNNKIELKDIKYHINNAKNQDLSPEEYRKSGFYANDSDTICDLYSAYEKELKKNNALDFDDLITKTCFLLKQSKETLDYVQEKFRYIHIDEFQDTNAVQYRLISLMASKYRNIFAVGDDDQSIYGFRGAEVENVYRFQEDFIGAKVLKLQRNYRSTKKILRIANQIIKKNTRRMQKELWTENPEGARPEKYEAYDENEEALYVSSMIRSLVNHEGYKYSDIAVLLRMNALSRPFEQEFLKYGLPYRIYGGFKFYERKEIKDIIAYLRIIVNPFDDESVLRVINFPKRGIGETAISALRAEAKAKNLSVYDIILNIQDLDISPAAKKKILSFRDIVVNIMRASETMDMSSFIKNLLEITGINSVYSEESEENINRRFNIDEFVSSFIKYFEDNPGSGLEEYLTSVTLISDIDNMDDKGISVATIHSAKGLEFRVVFICGLDDGIFPVKRAYNEQEDWEEERRLMYVAITRAKEKLFFTRAKSRYLYGERKSTRPSEFFSEIFPEESSGTAFRCGNFQGTFSGGNYIKNAPYSSPAKSGTDKRESACGDVNQYKEGSRIYHRIFGEGTIVSINGKGDSAIADIAFPKIGIKTFTLKFTPIKLI